MLAKIQNRGQKMRILLWIIIGFIALSMVITLLPGSLSNSSASPDVVVEVAGKPITVEQVRQQIQRLSGGRAIPPQFESIYATQVLDQLIMERLMEVEAERQGFQVTLQEQAERIRMVIPAARTGDMQQYAAEVQQRTQMSVPEFEEAVRKIMLSEKFVSIVTDGITVSPDETNEEFRRRNEKITVEYALIRPEEMESKVTLTEAEIAAHYEKNKATYLVPERRSIRYALLDSAQARAKVSVSEDELRSSYNQNIEQYRLQNRAKVSHILFKTVGKTDAEVEEIRKKADDTAKKARTGKFEDLAKQLSEDSSKDKGGDIGWIVPGQTVAEFEKAAFSLPLKTISDPVKTEYGYHIIRVAERENARTQPFEEVRATILPVLTAQKADRTVSDLADKIGSAVRQNSKITLEDLAKQFSMTLGEAGPSAVREAHGALGLSDQLDDSVFRLRLGELSSPIQVPQGFVVLSLKAVEAAHAGTLAEVRSRVESDLRHEKTVALAKSRAEELAAKAKSGNLSAVAKSLGVTTKTSEAFSRTGSIPDIGGAKALSAAFSMNQGEIGPATSLGSNWVVYRVASKEPIKADQVAAQMKEVEQSVLQSKRQLAFEAFREALRKRLTDEGKIKYNTDNLKRLTAPKQ